jgi:hypothetical protein
MENFIRSRHAQVSGTGIPWYLILGVGALTLFVFAHITKKLRATKYKLPPQVPGLPIFGNTFQVPATQQGPWAKKLAKTYGEM